MQPHDTMYALEAWISGHSGLSKYFAKKGVRQETFWQQLRTDMQRRTPANIEAYLTDPASRLNDPDCAAGFGRDLFAARFAAMPPDVVRERIQALILLCLEKSAAYALAASRPAVPGLKQTLKTLLQLPEVP